MMEPDNYTCPICEKSLEGAGPVFTARHKGAKSINDASEKRGNDLHVVAGQRFHTKCRSEYTNPITIACDLKRTDDASSNQLNVSLRSESPKFDFRKHCIFCGESAKYSGKKRSIEVHEVSTGIITSTLSKLCAERKDEWADIVAGRLSYVQDLFAADAVYHQTCSVNFRTKKQLPLQFSSDASQGTKKVKHGRPADPLKAEAFSWVAKFLLENDDEQLTLQDLIDKMDEFLHGTGVEPYSAKQTKRKLMDTYGDALIITEINGKSNVVTFRKTAESIVYDFYQHTRNKDPEQQKSWILETAAKLLRSDIRSQDTSSDVYPTADELQSVDAGVEFLPKSLRTFLQDLFIGQNIDKKLASIGQAIMQATRPRVLLAPLQLGLGVQMHHAFASRFLIDSLHQHGFCCSYAEVQQFERSATVNQGTELPEIGSDQLLQHVADNVDHNIRTLDGFGTFHGMGIIAVVTPGKVKIKPVPRAKVKTEEIRRIGRIDISYFNTNPSCALPITYAELPDTFTVDQTAKADILWKTSLLLRMHRPAWSGMMQTIHKAEHPGRSAVVFMPMIDMDPSDLSCIYSTLHFVSQQAMRHKTIPIVTFDQPLWWKAVSIIQQEPVDSVLKSMIVRLGGLHIEMSFLGCIGHLMAGSGLEELLAKVYAENAVKHMLTGKAVARAIRGHFLVDAALNTILISNAYNVPLPHMHQPEEGETLENVTMKEGDTLQTSGDDLSDARELLHKLLNSGDSMDAVTESKSLDNISARLQDEKASMTNLRTANLWLQYMEMIDIFRKFLKAERVGNWCLHLEAVREMLPFFAAAGHHHYTKSGYIYLQQMEELSDKHPDVYQKFIDGYHVVRRNDRFWAGLSTDLVIEQVLMRSMKTSGGLTRGRGMSEAQRLIWLLSTPACANVNLAMQEFTGANYLSSEQHKDTSKARQSRDTEDTFKLLNILKDWDPFGADPSLHSISSGVLAKSSVNVDTAKQVGECILNNMKGKTVDDFTFRRKDVAVTLASGSKIIVHGQEVQVDPLLLFQRLTVFTDKQDDPKSLFEFELCSYPASLFESSGLPRKANKPVLADAIWDLAQESIDRGQSTQSFDSKQLTDSTAYVLDGGALLQRVPWKSGSTFNELCSQYVEYINRRYKNVTIVFDGYECGPSIKDATHQRRTSRKAIVPVHFTSQMVNKIKKDEFLTNPVNKQRFINLLAVALQNDGHKVIHAKSDADVPIVLFAVESAKSTDTVVVGDDTDLLILLCFHADLQGHDLLFMPEHKKNTKKHKVWNIKEIKLCLGDDICNRLLFVHAILGCDSTSQPFGIGKGKALKMVKEKQEFADLASAFMQSGIDLKDITDLGEQALVSLYGGANGERLNCLRHRRFSEKVARSSKHVEPQNLPPTAAAAKFHSLRTYFQIDDWKGHSSLNPEEYGWKHSEGMLLPIMTDKPAAAQDLLNIIHCNCRTGCTTKRCTCKVHGLDCNTACGQCKGISCMNSPKPDLDDQDEDWY